MCLLTHTLTHALDTRTLDRGTDTSLAPPCAVDRTHSAEGSHSIKCNVQYYPMPNPFQSSDTPSDTTRLSPSDLMRVAATTPSYSNINSNSGGGVGLQSEPMIFNYSGPLSSDPIPVLPGSTYVIRFKSSWMGNWTGAFVASVSLYQ
jgi:hypothetical protein